MFATVPLELTILPGLLNNPMDGTMQFQEILLFAAEMAVDRRPYEPRRGVSITRSRI